MRGVRPLLLDNCAIAPLAAVSRRPAAIAYSDRHVSDACASLSPGALRETRAAASLAALRATSGRAATAFSTRLRSGLHFSSSLSTRAMIEVCLDQRLTWLTSPLRSLPSASRP